MTNDLSIECIINLRHYPTQIIFWLVNFNFHMNHFKEKTQTKLSYFGFIQLKTVALQRKSQLNCEVHQTVNFQFIQQKLKFIYWFGVNSQLNLSGNLAIQKEPRNYIFQGLPLGKKNITKSFKSFLFLKSALNIKPITYVRLVYWRCKPKLHVFLSFIE